MSRRCVTLSLALCLLLTHAAPARAQQQQQTPQPAPDKQTPAPPSAEQQTTPPPTQPGAQTQQQQPPPQPSAQQPPPAPADRRVEKIRRVVNKVGVGGNITVFLKNGEDLHGTVSRIGAEDFDVAEVDLQRLITVRYEFTEKVREGYTHVNPFTGKRRGPRQGARIAALAGGLFIAVGLPLILLARMKE